MVAVRYCLPCGIGLPEEEKKEKKKKKKNEQTDVVQRSVVHHCTTRWPGGFCDRGRCMSDESISIPSLRWYLVAGGWEHCWNDLVSWLPVPVPVTKSGVRR